MPLDNYGRHYTEFREDVPGTGRWPRTVRTPRLMQKTIDSGGMGNALRVSDAIEHEDIHYLEGHARWYDIRRHIWRNDWNWISPIKVKVNRGQARVS